MSSPVYVITGFKREKFGMESKQKVLPDGVTGRLGGFTKTIMHGVAFVGNDKPLGYAYLKASLQKIEDFESTPIGERGVGALCGGFISSTNVTTAGLLCTEQFTNEQEWGDVDTSNARYLCGFYNAKLTKYNRVMACFDRVNAAPISGFWRNGKAVVGPNSPCEKTDWAINLKSKPDDGNYGIVLEKVKSTVVRKVEFLEVLANAMKTVKPEVMYSEVFANGSSARVKDNFIMKTTLLDTHAFAFQEGMEVDWSSGWKAKVPLVSAANTTVKVDVFFAAHQTSAISKTRMIDRSAKILLAPMIGCKATAKYMKSVLTVNAVLTVQKTYTNGAVRTCEVPAKYTGVSCDCAEIKMEGISLEPLLDIA